MGAKSGRRRVRERPARANKLEGKGRDERVTTINDAASGVSEQGEGAAAAAARRQIYYDTSGTPPR